MVNVPTRMCLLLTVRIQTVPNNDHWEQVDAQKEEIRVLDKEATRARNACTALENEKQRMAAKCDTLEREQHSANQAKHAAEQLLRKAQNQQSIKVRTPLSLPELLYVWHTRNETWQ